MTAGPALPGPGEEELRAALLEAAEWVSAYLRDVGERPVLAQVEPGDIAGRRCPSTRPARASRWSAILADVDRLILPGITHWNHPPSSPTSGSPAAARASSAS